MNRTSQPLDVDALRAALGDAWAQVDVVATTGSTNADLLRAAAAGAPDRTVLVAEHQEAGRGRLARSWVSPPGSLALSVLLRPSQVPASRFGWLPLLTGLAVLDAVHAFGAETAGVKWPNDLLLGPDLRKAGGILAEAADPAGRPAVVVGIGINVSMAPADHTTATSLAAEGVHVDRAELLVALLARLAARDTAWRAGRGDPDLTRLRADYRAGCVSLGAEVRVELPGGAVFTGIAEDVDTDGRLLLLDDAGRRRAVAAGDVVHLRNVR